MCLSNSINEWIILHCNIQLMNRWSLIAVYEYMNIWFYIAIDNIWIGSTLQYSLIADLPMQYTRIDYLHYIIQYMNRWYSITIYMNRWSSTGIYMNKWSSTAIYLNIWFSIAIYNILIDDHPLQDTSTSAYIDDSP